MALGGGNQKQSSKPAFRKISSRALQSLWTNRCSMSGRRSSCVEKQGRPIRIYRRSKSLRCSSYCAQSGSTYSISSPPGYPQFWQVGWLTRRSLQRVDLALVQFSRRWFKSDATSPGKDAAVHQQFRDVGGAPGRNRVYIVLSRCTGEERWQACQSDAHLPRKHYQLHYSWYQCMLVTTEKQSANTSPQQTKAVVTVVAANGVPVSNFRRRWREDLEPVRMTAFLGSPVSWPKGQGTCSSLLA